jgi:hypothetical protein
VEGRIKKKLLILGVLWLLFMLAMTAAWYFMLIKPQTERMTKAENDLQARRTIANRMATALDEQKKSEDRLKYLDAQLFYFRQRYRSLPFGDIGTDPANLTDLQRANRINAWRRWLNEYYSDYYDSLRGSLISIAQETGVDINAGSPRIDAPPKAPEDLVIPPTGFFRPASNTNNGVLNITVTGSLDNILRFFTRVNYSPILMVIGNVKLDIAGGNNQGGQQGAPSGPPGATGQPNALLASNTTDPTQPPNLTATFTVTPYLLASGEGAKLQTGVANLAQPAAGTVPTGPPGSTPTGPPGTTPSGPPPSASPAPAP